MKCNCIYILASCFKSNQHRIKLNMFSMNQVESTIIMLLLLLAVSSCTSQNSSTVTGCLITASPINIDHCNNNSSCPTWFVCNAENRCQCDKITNKIVCDDEAQISAVLNCNCVTYNSESKLTFVGSCFYNCLSSASSDLYIKTLPKNPEILINNSACTPFHRTGLLCGDCEEGYSPLVLSYNLSCVECPNGHENWWKFILAGFLPLTVFYLFILVFNVNVTSSRLHGVVWYSQFISMPAFLRIAQLVISNDYMYYKKYLKAIKVSFSLYSLWNLDLFRSVLPDICLNITTLQALTIEYLIALYPFVLILLSYILIVLHDRRVQLVVAVWKPFKRVVTFFRKSWDIRTSVLDSFATFFLLSYIKILNVTADVLIPTQIRQLASKKSTFGVYYSPSVSYFGDQHLPYAILALTLVTLFVSIPTIIFILYPCRFFQNFLSLFPINWHFLHAFVDSFQGSYKDGTEPGTRDCRWFSVPMLLVWPLVFIIYGLTLSIMFFVYSFIILLILLIAKINIQPLKLVDSRYPLVDLIFIFLLGLAHIVILERGAIVIERYQTYHAIIAIIMFLATIFPLFYISFLIGSWLFSRIKIYLPQQLLSFL